MPNWVWHMAFAAVMVLALRSSLRTIRLSKRSAMHRTEGERAVIAQHLKLCAVLVAVLVSMLIIAAWRM